MFRFRDPELSWMMSRGIKTLDQMAEGVRDSIMRTTGMTLTQKCLVNKVVLEALANPLPRVVVPVVVVEASPEEVVQYKAIFNSKVVTVDLTDVDDVDEVVVKTFNQIKDQMATKEPTAV